MTKARDISNSDSLLVNASGDSMTGSLTTTESLRANSGGPDGGPVLRAWTDDPGNFTGIATNGMTGKEYMLISNGTDTYMSAGAGGVATIRGGANSTAASIAVSTTAVTVVGDLNANYVNSNQVVSGVTVPAAGRGLLCRQPSGDGSDAIIQFTNFGVTAQRATINASSGGALSLNSTTAYWNAIYNTTLTGTANIQSSSDMQLRRTTSSARYKKDIETLDHEIADKILDLRPVWFRAKENNIDNPEQWSYVGLIAEEVAEIEPRLVYFKQAEPTLDEHGNMVTDEEGKPVLNMLETPVPESVQYDKLTVYLLDIIKREKARSDELEARIIALEESINNG
ncbi:tail fiber domain-containing protein [Arenimonas sp.]|jgi:hypothetical protein|uniref:tail fiber domain-containing protein n=1 Tax=Arenimonas sp. TaxID=1872635 RepID=UPI0037BE5F10